MYRSQILVFQVCGNTVFKLKGILFFGDRPDPKQVYSLTHKVVIDRSIDIFDLVCVEKEQVIISGDAIKRNGVTVAKESQLQPGPP